MNHKYDEAAVGNRILKADIETLRAKVRRLKYYPPLLFLNYPFFVYSFSNSHVMLR